MASGGTSMHTNATAENHHLINAGALAKMKDGVLLVNTARGTLIDPDALIAGLESGKIGAAGLDVLENENGLFYFNHMGDALQNRLVILLAERGLSWDMIAAELGRRHGTSGHAEKASRPQ